MLSQHDKPGVLPTTAFSGGRQPYGIPLPPWDGGEYVADLLPRCPRPVRACGVRQRAVQHALDKHLMSVFGVTRQELSARLEK